MTVGGQMTHTHTHTHSTLELSGMGPVGLSGEGRLFTLTLYHWSSSTYLAQQTMPSEGLETKSEDLFVDFWGVESMAIDRICISY